jgi:hypothetical protein
MSFNINFSNRSPSPEHQSYWDAFRDWKDFVVSFIYPGYSSIHVVSCKEANVVFHEVIEGAIVPTSKEQFESLLQDKELVPLPLIKNKEDIDPDNFKQIAFVSKIALKKLGLLKRDLPTSSLALRLIQAFTAISSASHIKSLNIYIRKELEKKWAEPIRDDLILKAQVIESGLKYLFDPKRHLALLEHSRTAGSDTYQKNPEKLTFWKEAGALIEQIVSEKKELSLDLFKQLNLILLGPDALALEGGEFRSFNVQAGGPGGPSYPDTADIPEMIQQTFDWINVQDPLLPTLVKSALAYQRLVSIHPFGDANGRTCRLMMDAIALSADLPPAMVGDDVSVAIFGGDVDPSTPCSNPNLAVEKILKAYEKTLEFLNSTPNNRKFL